MPLQTRVTPSPRFVTPCAGSFGRCEGAVFKVDEVGLAGFAAAVAGEDTAHSDDAVAGDENCDTVAAAGPTRDAGAAGIEEGTSQGWFGRTAADGFVARSVALGRGS